MLNSHEDKIFKLREKFEDKKRAALSDLEKDLLEERKQKYRKAIAAPDVPVKYFLVFQFLKLKLHCDKYANNRTQCCLIMTHVSNASHFLLLPEIKDNDRNLCRKKLRDSLWSL